VKRPTLYIETSVFGFYYDEKEENKFRKEASVKLFDQISKGLFAAYYSTVTLAKLQKSKDPVKRQRLLKLIDRFGLERLPEPEEFEDVGKLATSFIEQKIIPVIKKDDAFHLAIAILSPPIDYLVTWNYKHLANINILRQIKSASLSIGYEVKFDVVTPEEVIYYEGEV